MVKPGRFNAEINRITAARARQTRVRQQVGAINGGPTYLRAMSLEGMQKQQMKNFGNLALKMDRVKHAMGYRSGFFGDIYFDNGANQGDYEDAVVAAKNVDYNAAPANYRASFPIDDAVKNSAADIWSIKQGKAPIEATVPNDNALKKLYAEAEKDLLELEKKGTAPDFENSTEKTDYVIALYKEKVARQEGALKRPFQESTMQLSLPSDNRDAGIALAVSQLVEIDNGITSLEKALYKYNEEIKVAEQAYYKASTDYTNLTKQVAQYNKVLPVAELDEDRKEIKSYLESEATNALAEKEAMQALLNGRSGAEPGLRYNARQVRTGIHALQNQRSVVEGTLGIDKDAIEERVAKARGTGAAAGGTIGLVGGGMLVLGLVWLFRNQAPTGPRRGRRDEPISIFTD